MKKLLGTSPTESGIAKVINTFWCSNNYTVENGQIKNTATGKVPLGFSVTKKQGRYRFEYEKPGT